MLDLILSVSKHSSESQTMGSQHIFLEKAPLGAFSFEYSCDLTSNSVGHCCVGIEAVAS
jgi:hypothetical protein